jgi:hypothetical protein
MLGVSMLSIVMSDVMLGVLMLSVVALLDCSTSP